MMRKYVYVQVPCDCGPPPSDRVEGINGWYTKAWTPKAIDTYRKDALMKPKEVREYGE